HDYAVGARSGRFYAMWHGRPAFEPVAGTAKEFIQWVIRERSDHLPGCTWEVFITGEIQFKDAWHREQVDTAPVGARWGGGLDARVLVPPGVRVVERRAGNRLAVQEGAPRPSLVCGRAVGRERGQGRGIPDLVEAPRIRPGMALKGPAPTSQV